MVESIRMPKGSVPRQPLVEFDRNEIKSSSLAPDNVLGKIKVSDIGEHRAGYFYVLRRSDNPHSEKVDWNGVPGYREYVEEDVKNQD